MLSELQHQLSEETLGKSSSERSSSSNMKEINQSSAAELTDSWKFSEGVLDHSQDENIVQHEIKYGSSLLDETATQISSKKDGSKNTWTILPKPAEEVHLSNLPTWPRRQYKEL